MAQPPLSALETELESARQACLAGDQKRGSTEHLRGRLRFLTLSAESYVTQGKLEDALRSR